MLLNSIKSWLLTFFLGSVVMFSLLFLASQYVLHKISANISLSSNISQANHWLWIFALVSILAGILISFIISKKITTAIDKIIMHVDEIANGNLTQKDVNAETKELISLHTQLNRLAITLKEQNEYSEAFKQDILEQEQELNHAMNEQNAIFDSAGMGIALMLDRKILKCNKAFEQLFGYSTQQLTNSTIEKYYVNENDFSKVGSEGYAIIAQGKTYTEAYEFKHRSGNTFMCRISGKAIHPNDLNQGTVWIFEDVTERRKLLNALKSHSQFLETLVDAIPIPVFYKDEQARFLEVNKAYEEAFGIKRKHVIGKTVAELNIYSETERVKFLEEDFKVINQQLNEAKKRDILFADGQVHHTIYWLKGFKHNDGSLAGQVGTIIDNTEQELAQVAMQHAKESAEETSRMKSDFLANMSHEIRTPMNAIIGMSHLMLKTALTPKQQDYQIKVQQSGQHLLGVINDILDFSKIEAGELNIESSQINLDKIIENVFNLVAFKAKEKGLNLIVDMDAAVPKHVLGDGLRISQILINYVNNAVKFTDSGEIRIIIHRVAETDDSVELYFAVQDTGIGISDKDKSKLFNSFQQADSSTTRKFGGTGLGLAISKNLAMLMNGSVGLDSEAGKGSTFWLQLSLKKVSKDHIVTPENYTQFSGQRVLVVDDNEVSRKVLADLLSDLSLRVDMAISGEEAISMTRDAANAETPYQIIFIDWHMPDMDGFEATQKINSLGLPIKATTVLVTAFGREDVLSNAAKLGIESVLIKPIDHAILLDTVNHIFRIDTSLQQTDFVAPSPLNDISKLAGYHVLVVEDNELNQEVAVELLKHANITADVANNGQEALDKLKENTYDIVLMDMQMPVMGGVIATIEIRKQSQFSNLPVIAMTANVLKEDREKCITAGMNDFLPKPIEPEILWSMLFKWITPRSNREIPSFNDIDSSQISQSRLTLSNDKKVPETIEGLDVRAGLKRVLGKEDLYLSMLTKFLNGQQHVIASMQQSLQTKDWPTLERIAHTLKGLAANIGAQHIADKASLVESAAKQENIDEVNNYLESLAGPLEKILSALSEALMPLNEDMVSEVETDTTLATSLLEKLSALLLDNDADALEFVQTNRAIFQQLFADKYILFRNSIEQFSFDDAYQLIQPFLNSSHETTEQP